ILHLSLIIVFILLIVLYIVKYGDLDKLSSALLQTDPLLLFLTFLLMFIVIILYTIRWIVNIRAIGAHKSSRFGMALGTTSYGLLYGLMLPAKIGQYVKATVLQKVDGVPYTKGISAVNIEVIAELGYLAIMTIISIVIAVLFLSAKSYWDVNTSVILIVILLVVFLIFILFPTKILMFISKKLVRDKGGKKSKKRLIVWLKTKLDSILKNTAELVSDRKILNTNFVITLVIGLLSFLIMYLLISALGEYLNFAFVVFAVTISVVVGIISMIPGGIGTMDFSLLGILITGGISSPHAAAIIILWRVVLLIPLTVIFLICFFRYFSIFSQVSK
ncbi:flippase-like domain-containing protein, partial [Candidatus Pacearchaeota archaeon]|nr:flippase-like domain-containing protein [Candidatus Pacearchaeota archaeon]